MTVPDDALVAFLRARYDEREARANSWPDGVDYDENMWVLADVAAKRQIIDELIRLLNGEDEFAWRTAEVLIRLLALPFAGHPEYREDFKP